MMNDDRLLELVVRWQEGYTKGRIPSVDELCAEYPELRQRLTLALPNLEGLTALLRRVRPEEATSSATPGGTNGSTAGDSPRFHVLRPHRKGGLGEVFIAYDGELEREVALKRMQTEHTSNTDSRRRFLREAKITGRLEHPGIVPVYSLAQVDDGPPSYAMRLIQGETLKEAIERFHNHESPKNENPKNKQGERALAFRQLLNRFVGVCQTMAYAHSRGIVHRDLKPSNIILGKYGETLVVDWGLAKRVVSGQASEGDSEESGQGEATDYGPRTTDDGLETATGEIVGTLQYLSPEQATGRAKQSGPQSDIYSLGATLYCLLTGTAPFPDPREASVEAILEQVQRGQFRRPRQVRRRISPALEAICLKAMALRPEERYASAAALADDLEHWLADEPVAVYRETWLGRLRRWGRRHRPLVTGLAATLVVGLVGLTAGLVVVTGLNRQLDAANADLKQKSKELIQANAIEKQSRDRAHNALGYFVDAFRRPDPSQDGEEVTVLEALNRSAQELPSRADVEPATRGALLNAIGQTYLGLGLPHEATNVLEQAVALNREHLGLGHADTLEAMNDLAIAYRAAGSRADALTLLQQTLHLKQTTLGSMHPSTLRSMGNLAIAYKDAGQLPEALSLFEETLEHTKAKLGPDHLSTLIAMHNLALAYRQAGRLSDAVPLFEETLERSEVNLGFDHPNTLTTMDNLARAYEAVGRWSEALPLFEETLKLRRQKLGADHLDSLTTMNNLANAYREAGRLSDALPLFIETVNLRKAKLGPDHPDVVASMNDLALAYREAGQQNDALPLLEAILKLDKEKLGAENRLAAINSLALVYRDIGRLSDAVPLFDEVLKLSKTKLGLEHPKTLAFMNNLASAHWETGQRAEALRLFEEELELRKAKLGMMHPDTLRTVLNLAQHMRAERKLAEAEGLLRDILSRRRAFAPDHPTLARSLAALGNILVDRGEAQEAEPLLRECLEMRRRSSPKGHQLTIDAENHLGRCLTALGRFSEAESLLLNSAETLKSKEGIAPAKLQQAAQNVIELYQAWEKPAQAAQWQAKLDQLKSRN